MSLNLLYRDSDKMAVNAVILTNGYKEINMLFTTHLQATHMLVAIKIGLDACFFIFLFFYFLIQCDEMSIGPIFLFLFWN